MTAEQVIEQHVLEQMWVDVWTPEGDQVLTLKKHQIAGGAFCTTGMAFDFSKLRLKLIELPAETELEID